MCDKYAGPPLISLEDDDDDQRRQATTTGEEEGAKGWTDRRLARHISESSYSRNSGALRADHLPVAELLWSDASLKGFLPFHFT